MRSQKTWPAVVLVLGVSLLFLPIPGCQGGQEAADQPQARQLLEQMKVSGDVPEAARKTLVEQVISDFRTMGALFKAKEFHCLAKLMGKRGVSLITVGFEKLPGAASAEYWRSLWKEGAELEFAPVNVFVYNLRARALVPYCAVMDQGITYEEWKRKADYYDAAAFLTFTYTVSGGATGETSDAVMDPPGSGTYLHKSGCPWG